MILFSELLCNWLTLCGHHQSERKPLGNGGVGFFKFQMPFRHLTNSVKAPLMWYDGDCSVAMFA